MRRLRTARTAPAVTLFPFLAVLLCTMGALIVVLVVIARQSRLQAAALAATTPAIELDAQRLLADQQRLQSLRARHAEISQNLTGQRKQLARLADEDRALRARLAELEQQAQSFSRAAELAPDPLRADAQLASIRQRIDLVRRQLADAASRAGNTPDTFAIVPYEGKNGTRRRPIYIECRGDSVVFQPEGIVLTEEDFMGPLDPGNPLAAGLLAASQYLARQAIADPQGAGDPYPLLLVRPDGVLAYAAARAAMRSWGADFGYELIDRDWPLEFPAVDPQMAAAMRDAIQAARQRQLMLARSAPRHWRSQKHPRFGTAGPPGASPFDSAAGPANSDTADTTSGAPRQNELGGIGPDALSSRPYAGRPGQAHSAGSPQRAGGLPPADHRTPSRYTPSASRGPLAEQTARAAAAGTPRGSEAGSSPTTSANTAPAGSTAASPPGSLRRRPGWALPESSDAAVGVTRPVSIICEAGRLTVVNETRSGRQSTVIRLSERTQDSIDELVSAVWQCVDSWGIAGRGMYWRPLLSVQVWPGGQRRFEDLKALLTDSGLDVAPAARAASAQYPRTRTPYENQALSR